MRRTIWFIILGLLAGAANAADFGLDKVPDAGQNLASLSPVDWQSLIQSTPIQDIANRPDFRPEYAKFIPADKLSQVPVTKLDVTKVPVENQKGLSKEQLLFKGSDGKSNIERLNLNDLSPAVRNDVIKSAAKIAPTDDLKVTTGKDPVTAIPLKDGVALKGKVSELKTGDALAQNVENVKITKDGMSFEVPGKTSVGSGTSSIPRPATTSPGQGQSSPATSSTTTLPRGNDELGSSTASSSSKQTGSSSTTTMSRGIDVLDSSSSRSPSSGSSGSKKQLILTIGNLQTFADNPAMKTSINLTKNQDATYTLTTTNAITRIDLGESTEYLIGEHSSALVHPQEGILQASIDSPGRYIREYNDHGPSILGAYPKSATFGRSFSIARPAGLGVYNITLAKPLFRQTRTTAYISDQELILPGIITYLRQGFHIKSEEVFNNTRIVDMQHTDDLYHPIIESNDAKNFLHIILDKDQLFTDINVTIQSYPESQESLRAHFEDMLIYQSRITNTKQLGAGSSTLASFPDSTAYHYSRFEHVNTPAVINTLHISGYPGVFLRQGDQIKIDLATGSAVFKSIDDKSTEALRNVITTYDNHMKCSSLDNSATVIPTNTTVIEMNDNQSTIRNIGWKYWFAR